MSAYRLEAVVRKGGTELPFLAEAVEKLWAGGQARNNGIGIVGCVNQYCL
jgi:hypothetical protein